jgi:hypothetical protein
MAKRKDFSGCINFPLCKAQVIRTCLDSIPAKAKCDEIISLLKGAIPYEQKKDADDEKGGSEIE